MSDDDLGPAEKRPRREFPVLAGLVALAAMVLVVGGVVGGAALFATRAAGLGDEATDAVSKASPHLIIPDTFDPETNPGGQLTLDPPSQESSSPAAPEPSETKPPKPEPALTLVAAQQAVQPMERIDLTGTYRDGDGAVLRVQQFEAGQWTDFPVTVAVTGGQFTTYIQAGAVGLNRFRVLDTDTGEASNDVRVQIG